MTTKVGGPLYIGAAPASEQLPEHDATINDNQVVGHAVLAGPITVEAILTITGVVVVL
tara:strand:- start:31 stop:204 length:174 start_codon:yes stop_codon:yes gene_type:complete